MSILTDIEDSVKTQLETGTFNAVQYYADLAGLPSTTLSLGTGRESGTPEVDDATVWRYEVDIGIEGRVSGNRGTNLSRASDNVVQEIKTLLINNSFFEGLTGCQGVVSTDKRKWRYEDKTESYFSYVITIQYLE